MAKQQKKKKTGTKSKADRYLEKKLDKRRKIIGKPKTRLA